MTPTFRQNLYIIIPVIVACSTLIFIVVLLYIWLKRNPRRENLQLSFRHASGGIPQVSKEIPEVKSMKKQSTESPDSVGLGERALLKKVAFDDAEVGIRSAGRSGSFSDADFESSEQAYSVWGKWYTLTELGTATLGFAEERIIGEGGCGVVYRGVLSDGSEVAVKNLVNKKGQAEKEFKVEVEAIGRVRHKNLVSLVGFCEEGDSRLLVYEYVGNGNLEQWLLTEDCPLTWDMRMKIAIGTAKGIAYLHEGLDPKVVHRDIKSSNILLDKMWNPKVSDFGLAKLLRSDASHVSTRIMGTFGYVSPDYASTGMLNAASDVYSFGVLLLEIIAGRTPVDYTRPAREVYSVEWFKAMVAARRTEEIVDRRMESPPSAAALRSALLVCLRCLDLDSTKRPKMGQVVHMLEGGC